MNVLPILERELRTEARHAFNYWMLDYGSSWSYFAQTAFLDSPLVLAGELQIVFALIAVGLLFRNLARRKFALA